MQTPKQVLIIQTASLGDVILATTLPESFHADDAGWQIDILVRKGSEGLFTGHPFVRNVLIWNKKEKKYAGLWKLLKDIRRTKYDHVINLQRFASTGFLTAFSGALYKTGFSKNPFSFHFTRKFPHLIGKDAGFHEIDRNLSLLKGIVKAVRIVKLYPSQDDFNEVEKLKQGKYIVIAPASLWETKRYPPEKWSIFIDSLPGDIFVYLIGSKSDIDLCNKIGEMCVKHSSLNLSGKLSLLQTAALMKDALMNFTNDSAPQHLASAMNAPVTTVFCSTVPEFGFGPLSDKMFVVETEEELSCRPCGLHGYKVCPKGHFKCALTITNEQLLSCLI
jgi:ADP-heptose:LPS heptosyltransferase